MTLVAIVTTVMIVVTIITVVSITVIITTFNTKMVVFADINIGITTGDIVYKRSSIKPQKERKWRTFSEEYLGSVWRLHVAGYHHPFCAYSLVYFDGMFHAPLVGTELRS